MRPAILPKPPEKNPRRWQAVLVSCIFHGTLLGLIVGWALLYPVKRLAPSGSAAAIPTLTLSTLVVAAKPPPPPRVEKKIAPARPAEAVIPPAPPAPPIPAPVVVKITPKVPVPPEGVPVLAPQPRTAKAAPRKPHKLSHVASSPPPAPSSSTTMAKPPAPSMAASSYAPGENVFPHPPYPEEARLLGKTGTVVVSVRFDHRGQPAQVDLTQSSGVGLLDSETRSYILAHWHTGEYAGQILRVPVRYTLEKL